METTRRHPNVVNADELDAWSPHTAPPRPFGYTSKELAEAAGSQKIGANLTMVPAGCTAGPLHAHLGNEEALFLLRGRGTLRIGAARVPVRSGDWIALPAGEQYAHQLLADQGEELQYLAISTMNEADVITFPDSQKIMARVGGYPPTLRKIFHQAAGDTDYWEGEGDPGQEKPPQRP